MRYIPIEREFKDKEGNKATEWAKAHAYHRIENGNTRQEKTKRETPELTEES